MPYVPAGSNTTISSKKFNKVWPSTNKKDMDITDTGSILPNTTKEQESKPQTISSRDSAIKQVKDILSTSPQLSTSPRRKSAPESFSRKYALKVDLPSQEMPEMLCLLRKKSGEVVKSSLKKGNSKSEPTTPTFPKYVHFNADLEQIKLFNEAQRPQAVSADASSDEDSDDDDDDDDDDDEFDFSISDDDDDGSKSIEEPELLIFLPNIPMITTMHSSRPVFLESVTLSSDKKLLQGRVMVQNFAFQKTVDIRYTFDFWSSVSEVPASYAEGIPSKENKNSFDRFLFSIELIDNSRNPIDGKTMYFAIHYNVDNRDFWDNNNGSNYQVNFKRVSIPNATQSISKKNPPIKSQNISSNWSMSSTSRPTKNLDDSLCRSPPTLNSSRLLIDSRRKLLGRYDIGVSLSAAQNAPRSTLNSANVTTRTFQSTYYISPPTISYGSENFSSFFPGNYIDGMPGTSDLSSSSQWDDARKGFEPLKQNSNPIAIPSSKPVIGSSSYYDLVNQYCFYPGSPYTTNSPYATSPPVMTSTS